MLILSLSIAIKNSDKIYIESKIKDKFEERFPFIANPYKVIYIPDQLVRNKKVLFMPENDTHVSMMQGLFGMTSNYEISLLYESNREAAGEALEKLGLYYYLWKQGLISKLNPGIVVLGDDWGDKALEVIDECRHNNIPTACIQEGCLDWGPPINRMEFSDYPLIQGFQTTRYLQQETFSLTGNPRFDNIYQKPLPTKQKVMINSNFTYGIFEDERDRWIFETVRACKSRGLNFFISQHPRDNGKLK